MTPSRTSSRVTPIPHPLPWATWDFSSMRIISNTKTISPPSDPLRKSSPNPRVDASLPSRQPIRTTTTLPNLNKNAHHGIVVAATTTKKSTKQTRHRHTFYQPTATSKTMNPTRHHNKHDSHESFKTSQRLFKSKGRLALEAKHSHQKSGPQTRSQNAKYPQEGISKQTPTACHTTMAKQHRTKTMRPQRRQNSKDRPNHRYNILYRSQANQPAFVLWQNQKQHRIKR